MPERTVLTVNTGSSSLKAAVFDEGDLRDRHLTAQVEHIGHESALRVTSGSGEEIANEPLVANDHGEALAALIDWLANNGQIDPLLAVGHRLVHGGTDFSAPQRIDDAMIAVLETLTPFAPNHMPQALAAIAATRRAFPELPQVACFDTAFHRTMPPVAQRYPLPPEFEQDGVIRYGFHGLSYASIVDQLGDQIQPRTVIAHLGNGASMAALRDGQSVDTTMGFTPLGGLMMGTRSGDLDPGTLLYLLRQTGKTIDEVADLVTNQAGLRGVSQRSADMKTLLDHEDDDSQTAIALELYVYLARKQLGGLLAVLGGIDLLVFTGGIGEHAAEIRERIGAGFEFAGIRIDPAKNDPSSPSVIPNAVNDLSRSDVPGTPSSFENPSTYEDVSGQPRGEILRVAQNDNGGEGSESETGLRATRGPSASLGTTDGMEISYSSAPVRVLVLPSDEERMIARDTVGLIARENAS